MFVLNRRVLGVAVAATLGSQVVNVKRADIYRQSVAIHREMSKATHMDWGNPLPFKSEILTRWGPGGSRAKSRRE